MDSYYRLVEQLSPQLEQIAAEREQEQSRTVVELEESRQQLSQENDELKLTVRKLTDQLYGRRSERFVADPDQLSLDFGDDTAAAAEALAEAVWEAERKNEDVESRRKGKRRYTTAAGRRPARRRRDVNRRGTRERK